MTKHLKTRVLAKDRAQRDRYRVESDDILVEGQILIYTGDMEAVIRQEIARTFVASLPPESFEFLECERHCVETVYYTFMEFRRYEIQT